MSVRLDCGGCLVRGWRDGDRAALVSHADNRKIWRNLKDRFPHPYTQQDAGDWLALARAQPERPVWAIEIDGEAAGCIGLEPLADIYARTALIGYWLGEAYWGRGLMTAIVQRVSALALGELGFLRLEAPVMAWNPASMRVLEKCGFAREATLRKSVSKDGEVIDSVLYAKVAP